MPFMASKFTPPLRTLSLSRWDARAFPFAQQGFQGVVRALLKICHPIADRRPRLFSQLIDDSPDHSPQGFCCPASGPPVPVGCWPGLLRFSSPSSPSALAPRDSQSQSQPQRHIIGRDSDGERTTEPATLRASPAAIIHSPLPSHPSRHFPDPNVALVVSHSVPFFGSFEGHIDPHPASVTMRIVSAARGKKERRIHRHFDIAMAVQSSQRHSYSTTHAYSIGRDDAGTKPAKPLFVRNATPPRLDRTNTARFLRGLCKEVPV
ncbi:hypothetical protein BDP55DRAFT_629102 [Colletotrichum godetiae]|uniref:Uncharacterized protein n=1 Tax=Colletotrichum godetiae TaxID=1209918 RepID=A0AAJ0ARM8_9PEZI|nr:uncharacterized protein BDP55DRAFT_629102 [Colletotrichum godetiae]KAK1689122.1 hypothetical protein BDP55DRAFT_629102 [Colletotrichum godetiae]